MQHMGNSSDFASVLMGIIKFEKIIPNPQSAARQSGM
jgi:hypothetical protein